MLKSQKSKYSYITYPFFGLFKVPEISVEFDKISTLLSDSYKTAKINSSSSNYLEELLSIDSSEKNERIKFQVTAQSTQELIMLPRRCVWGVDTTGRIHNLSRYQEFEHISIKPTKITLNKYIWFNKVTRPITVPMSIKNIEEDLLYYWFSFLYIDNVWELYRIHGDYNRKNTEWL